MPLDLLIAAQLAWARNRWPSHESKRAPSLDDNLIRPLLDPSRAEFGHGAGGELGSTGKPGKMTSLRSSSALAYNVFGPWRDVSQLPLAAALAADVTSQDLRFEQPFRHGLKGIPPNIDVVLDLGSSQPLGVECKFTEPYGPKKAHPVIDAKYFAGGVRRWADVDLPKCQVLAASVGDSVGFRRLSAGQLLKHLLGLAHTTLRPPRLRYVWFDAADIEADEHRAEVARFSSLIDVHVDFHALTYQQVFRALLSSAEPMHGYLSYLSGRYFVA